MRREKYSKWIILLIVVVAIMLIKSLTNESRAAGGRYPSRLIQVVICYQPGATDMAIRPFVDKLPDYLGQPLAFVYKPGAAGALGASFVAKAKPDGYTLIGTPPSPVITAPLSKEGLDYTLDDFVPICRLVKSYLIVAVKADSPWKTLKDIVEEAKKSPGKLTYSTGGVFSDPHILMEIFVKSAGINMTHVPCEGSVPAVTALLGGHVNMTCPSMNSLSPHLKSGALRLIGVFEKERLREFSDIPAFSELGYPVLFSFWYGLVVPKGTPEEVVRTINTACKKVVDDHKDFIEDRLGKMSLKLAFLKTEELAEEVKVQNEALKKIFKDLMKFNK